MTAARNLCNLMLEMKESLGCVRQADFVGSEPLMSDRTYELATVTDIEYYDGTESMML